jgi:hypothetical protein
MLTSAFSGQAFSEEDKASLPPVVVTANRFEDRLTGMSASTTIITAEQIRSSGASDVNEAIRKIAGVLGRQNLIGSSDSAIDLRGFGTTSEQNLVVMVDGIRLSVTRATNVWYDEIYVGFDNTMNFSCPTTTRRGTNTVQPVQKHWSFQEVHGSNSLYTVYNQMMRHYSHLDTTGSIPFDGQGQVKENQDIKLTYATGDYPYTQGLLHAGALVYITNSLRSAKSPTGASSTLVSPDGLWYQPPDGKATGGAGDGRNFWYTEYSHTDLLSPTMNGGVGACSSADLITWRFEGIVFHYTNLSDMVFGTPTEF